MPDRNTAPGADSTAAARRIARWAAAARPALAAAPVPGPQQAWMVMHAIAQACGDPAMRLVATDRAGPAPHQQPQHTGDDRLGCRAPTRRRPGGCHPPRHPSPPGAGRGDGRHPGRARRAPHPRARRSHPTSRCPARLRAGSDRRPGRRAAAGPLHGRISPARPRSRPPHLDAASHPAASHPAVSRPAPPTAAAVRPTNWPGRPSPRSSKTGSTTPGVDRRCEPCGPGPRAAVAVDPRRIDARADPSLSPAPAAVAAATSSSPRPGRVASPMSTPPAAAVTRAGDHPARGAENDSRAAARHDGADRPPRRQCGSDDRVFDAVRRQHNDSYAGTRRLDERMPRRRARRTLGKASVARIARRLAPVVLQQLCDAGAERGPVLADAPRTGRGRANCGDHARRIRARRRRRRTGRAVRGAAVRAGSAHEPQLPRRRPDPCRICGSAPAARRVAAAADANASRAAATTCGRARVRSSPTWSNSAAAWVAMRTSADRVTASRAR